MSAGRGQGWPSAATRVAAVIGDPVDHSLSPVLHNAAFAALGLDWVYLAFPVATGAVADAVAGFRALGLAGLSVTMPHKAAVAAEMDQLSLTATRLGAVNTVTRRGSDLVGDSTDGDGFLAALREDEGWDPGGRRCMVLGAGGAARAVVLALAEAGAVSVAVVARRAVTAQVASALAGRAGQVASIDAVGDAELVVNATPVGMTGEPSTGSSIGSGVGSSPGSRGGDLRSDLPSDLRSNVRSDLPSDLRSDLRSDLPLGLDPARLGAGQLVVDLVYHPPSTALLESARGAGARVANGLGTLIHQAGLQCRMWTGMDPPLEVMSAAVVAALATRGPSTS